MSIAISVAYGDGDSPTFMEAALLVLREAGAPLNIESVEIGKRIYSMDYPQGILPSAFKALDHSKLLLKGHVIKPEDHAYREVGEVVREHYGLTEEHRLTFTIQEHEAIAYINDQFAIFEAKDNSVAGFLLAWIMILEHVGLPEMSYDVRQALDKILEEGVPATPFMERVLGSKKSDAIQFAEAVSARLTGAYQKTGS